MISFPWRGQYRWLLEENHQDLFSCLEKLRRGEEGGGGERAGHTLDAQGCYALVDGVKSIFWDC